MADEAVGVVIDTGTGTTRSGVGGEEVPTCSVPSAVAWQRPADNSGNSTERKPLVVCGDDLRSKIELSWDGTGEFNVGRILRRCIVKRWNELDCLWESIMKKNMKFSPEEHPILLTEPPLNSKLARELLSQVAFEKLGVPAMYIAITSVLALYGSGKTCGLVVESGEGGTFTVPVMEGYVMHHACQRFDVGGVDLTALLCDMIDAKKQNIDISSSAENVGNQTDISDAWRRKFIDLDVGLDNTLTQERYMHAVKGFKEKFCYVATDGNRNVRQKRQDEDLELGKSFELPDGTTISLSNEERTFVPECMFNPSLLGRALTQTPAGGIHNTVFQSISKCDPEVRKEMFSNVVLAGGNTAFEGFDERLSRELSMLSLSCNHRTASTSIPLSVAAPGTSDRGESIWLGGAILASLSTFQQLWITKDEYDESGPTVSHRKCF